MTNVKEYDVALRLLSDDNTVEDGIALLKVAAEMGDSRAMCEYGILHNSPGMPIQQDQKIAFEWYLKSAEYGDDRGQYYVGLEYYEGTIVDRDYVQALKWFTLAAEKGYAMAQYYLGHMYFKGNGVPQDTKEAMRWFTLSVDRECNHARIALGNIFSDPEWPEHDYRYAHSLYTQAMNDGCPEAYYKIGMMHYNGIWVPQNHIKASQLFRLGVEEGNLPSIFMMGKMYYYGLGVSRDSALGMRYLVLASQRGHEGAAKFIADIEAQKGEKKWGGSVSYLVPVEVLYTPDLLERPKDKNLTRVESANSESKKKWLGGIFGKK